ncbi:uncharacterized protein BT62DRAFT_1013013 [Guyanagaster necrorhizus]|uniref:Uncharacterized protein n=1 Tax=Guyanagaster necrorhizus TaxID=856835 RepID=A0A9P7VGF4_9AGAR|nr:uncharacterized protein BT62DRAFT_1013013 [Guyanagaster necrorhizus MCA 3950]KAG7440097.1 hypothetical protein BT62DRAFT_1013013 [Guyanagaster necrorhizus MCA 3950]
MTIESFRSNLVCLITRTSLAAVFRRSAASCILTPIRDTAVEFLRATSAMWKEVQRFLEQGMIATAERRVRAAEVDYLRACEIKARFDFDDLLWDNEELLVAQLRRSWVRDSAPPHQAVLQLFLLPAHRHEGYSSSPFDDLGRCERNFRLSPLLGRGDEQDSDRLSKSRMASVLYTMKGRYQSLHPDLPLHNNYRSQELPIDPEYVGLWDPDESVWKLVFILELLEQS